MRPLPQVVPEVAGYDFDARFRQKNGIFKVLGVQQMVDLPDDLGAVNYFDVHIVFVQDQQSLFFLDHN